MAPLAAVDGRVVSLGFVGQPSVEGHADLLMSLVSAGYVPVVASIAADRDGSLYNVNADTMAAAVAIRTKAARLVILGATPGVLDARGTTVAALDPATETAMVAAGTIHAGMIAKIRACRLALAGGVPSATIGDGRDAAHICSMVGNLAHTDGASTAVIG
jgi:acetylglutamate kinase